MRILCWLFVVASCKPAARPVDETVVVAADAAPVAIVLPAVVDAGVAAPTILEKPACTGTADAGGIDISFAYAAINSKGPDQYFTVITATSSALKKKEELGRVPPPFTCSMREVAGKPMLTWRCSLDEGVAVGEIEVVTKDDASALVFRKGFDTEFVPPSGAKARPPPTLEETARYPWPYCARPLFHPKNHDIH